MTLSVIGSGFGRTGTMSMKMALEQLGFGPCHHMEEVLQNPEQLPRWSEAARGQKMNWDEVFQGYNSTVDWPGAHFWLELAEAYPEAKVVHTVRTSESWWASFSKTIATVITLAGNEEGNHLVRNVPELANAIITEQTLGGSCNDKAAAIAAFEQRTLDVINKLSPQRYLIFDVRQGWGPLCEFLEVDVPEGEFPRSNDLEEFMELSKTLR